MITFKNILKEIAPQENPYIPGAADPQEFIDWCENDETNPLMRFISKYNLQDIIE